MHYQVLALFFCCLGYISGSSRSKKLKKQTTEGKVSDSSKVAVWLLAQKALDEGTLAFKQASNPCLVAYDHDHITTRKLFDDAHSNVMLSEDRILKILSELGSLNGQPDYVSSPHFLSLSLLALIRPENRQKMRIGVNALCKCFGDQISKLTSNSASPDCPTIYFVNSLLQIDLIVMREDDKVQSSWLLLVREKLLGLMKKLPHLQLVLHLLSHPLNQALHRKLGALSSTASFRPLVLRAYPYAEYPLMEPLAVLHNLNVVSMSGMLGSPAAVYLTYQLQVLMLLDEALGVDTGSSAGSHGIFSTFFSMWAYQWLAVMPWLTDTPRRYIARRILFSENSRILSALITSIPNHDILGAVGELSESEHRSLFGLHQDLRLRYIVLSSYLLNYCDPMLFKDSPKFGRGCVFHFLPEFVIEVLPKAMRDFVSSISSEDVAILDDIGRVCLDVNLDFTPLRESSMNNISLIRELGGTASSPGCGQIGMSALLCSLKEYVGARVNGAELQTLFSNDSCFTQDLFELSDKLALSKGQSHIPSKHSTIHGAYLLSVLRAKSIAYDVHGTVGKNFLSYEQVLLNRVSLQECRVALNLTPNAPLTTEARLQSSFNALLNLLWSSRLALLGHDARVNDLKELMKEHLGKDKDVLALAFKAAILLSHNHGLPTPFSQAKTHSCNLSYFARTYPFSSRPSDSIVAIACAVKIMESTDVAEFDRDELEILKVVFHDHVSDYARPRSQYVDHFLLFALRKVCMRPDFFAKVLVSDSIWPSPNFVLALQLSPVPSLFQVSNLKSHLRLAAKLKVSFTMAEPRLQSKMADTYVTDLLQSNDIPSDADKHFGKFVTFALSAIITSDVSANSIKRIPDSVRQRLQSIYGFGEVDSKHAHSSVLLTLRKRVEVGLSNYFVAFSSEPDFESILSNYFLHMMKPDIKRAEAAKSPLQSTDTWSSTAMKAQVNLDKVPPSIASHSPLKSNYATVSPSTCAVPISTTSSAHALDGTKKPKKSIKGHLDKPVAAEKSSIAVIDEKLQAPNPSPKKARREHGHDQTRSEKTEKPNLDKTPEPSGKMVGKFKDSREMDDAQEALQREKLKAEEEQGLKTEHEESPKKNELPRSFNLHDLFVCRASGECYANHSLKNGAHAFIYRQAASGDGFPFLLTEEFYKFLLDPSMRTPQSINQLKQWRRAKLPITLGRSDLWKPPIAPKGFKLSFKSGIPLLPCAKDALEAMFDCDRVLKARFHSRFKYSIPHKSKPHGDKCAMVASKHLFGFKNGTFNVLSRHLKSPEPFVRDIYDLLLLEAPSNIEPYFRPSLHSAVAPTFIAPETKKAIKSSPHKQSSPTKPRQPIKRNSSFEPDDSPSSDAVGAIKQHFKSTTEASTPIHISKAAKRKLFLEDSETEGLNCFKEEDERLPLLFPPVPIKVFSVAQSRSETSNFRSFIENAHMLVCDFEFSGIDLNRSGRKPRGFSDYPESVMDNTIIQLGLVSLSPNYEPLDWWKLNLCSHHDGTNITRWNESSRKFLEGKLFDFDQWNETCVPIDVLKGFIDDILAKPLVFHDAALDIMHLLHVKGVDVRGMILSRDLEAMLRSLDVSIWDTKYILGQDKVLNVRHEDNLEGLFERLFTTPTQLDYSVSLRDAAADALIIANLVRLVNPLFKHQSNKIYVREFSSASDHGLMLSSPESLEFAAQPASSGFDFSSLQSDSAKSTSGNHGLDHNSRSYFPHSRFSRLGISSTSTAPSPVNSSRTFHASHEDSNVSTKIDHEQLTSPLPPSPYNVPLPDDPPSRQSDFVPQELASQDSTSATVPSSLNSATPFSYSQVLSPVYYYYLPPTYPVYIPHPSEYSMTPPFSERDTKSDDDDGTVASTSR
jgi:hypothetical protein